MPPYDDSVGGGNSTEIILESYVTLVNLYNVSDVTELTGNSSSRPEYSLGPELRSGSLGFGIPDTVFARRVVHYCFGTLLTLFGLAGLLGNGLVLYVFARYRRLRGGGGPLILSLASGDCMVSLLHFMPAYSSFHEDWAFGDLGCNIYAAVVGVGGLAALITLAVIAADRFSVIIGHPIQWISGKKACFAIWLFSALLVFPPFVGWSRFVREGLETSCSWDYSTRTWNNRTYYVYLLFFGFFLPVTVVIVSYVGIIIVICNHSTKMNGVTRNGIIHSKKKPTKSDLRTAQVILTIIICFLTSWTPYALISLFYQFGNGTTLSPLAVALPAIFAKASVVYNPIVYGLSHPHFRSAVRMLKARYLGGRHSTPQDRYHYQYSRAGFRGGKKPLVATRSRCHYDLQGLQRGSTSRQGQDQVTDPATTQKTFDFSRNSYDEVVVNRNGWVLLKMHSRAENSGQTFGTSVVPDIALSSALESTSFSEPDRLDADVVKMSTFRKVYEYRRPRSFHRAKSIFHSENCLTNLLRGREMERLPCYPASSSAGVTATVAVKTIVEQQVVAVKARGGKACLSACKTKNMTYVVPNRQRSVISAHSSSPKCRLSSRNLNYALTVEDHCSKTLRGALSKSEDNVWEGWQQRAHFGGERRFSMECRCQISDGKAVWAIANTTVESCSQMSELFSFVTHLRLKRRKCIRRKQRYRKAAHFRCPSLSMMTHESHHSAKGSEPVDRTFFSSRSKTNKFFTTDCNSEFTPESSASFMESSIGDACGGKQMNIEARPSTACKDLVSSGEVESDIFSNCEKTKDRARKYNWGFASSAVVNLIKFRKKNKERSLQDSELQLPSSYFTFAECSNNLSTQCDRSHFFGTSSSGVPKTDASCIDRSIPLTPCSHDDCKHVNLYENPFSYCQDSVYSDGGSDIFYSCS